MCIIRLLSDKKIVAHRLTVFLQVRDFVSALCKKMLYLLRLSAEKCTAFTRHTSVLSRIDLPVFSEILLALKLPEQFLLKASSNIVDLYLVLFLFFSIGIYIFLRLLIMKWCDASIFFNASSGRNHAF